MFQHLYLRINQLKRLNKNKIKNQVLGKEYRSSPQPRNKLRRKVNQNTKNKKDLNSLKKSLNNPNKLNSKNQNLKISNHRPNPELSLLKNMQLKINKRILIDSQLVANNNTPIMSLPLSKRFSQGQSIAEGLKLACSST